MKTCATCHRKPAPWPHAYTRLDLSAEFPRYRTETRYVCDECEGE